MRFALFFKTILFSVTLPLIASAMEIRPAASFLFPAKMSIENKNHGILSEKTPKSEFMLQGDLEFLFSAQYAPLRYGFGLGYKSRQVKDDVEYTPATLPVWLNLTFGSILDDRFIAPYATARLGYVMPLDFDDPWWEKPTNYMVYIGAGCVFPHDFAIEVGYDYTSLLKSFESKKQSFRISSGRLAIRLSIGFELSHERTMNRVIIHHNEEEEEDFIGETPKAGDDTSFEESLQSFEDSLSTANSLKAIQEEAKQQEASTEIQQAEPKKAEMSSEISEGSSKKRKSNIKKTRSKKTTRKK